MDFELSDEQLQLRDVMRSLLGRESTSAAVRSAVASETGYDERLWRILGEQIGAHAFAIPEDRGGAGFSLVETAIVLEELARHLTPSPYLGSSVLAAQALLALDESAAAERLLALLATGGSVVAIGWAGPEGRWGMSDSNVREARSLLYGSAHYVLDGSAADTVLIVATEPTGLGLYLLDSRSSGVAVSPMTTMDQTRRLATVTLDAACGERLGDFASGAIRLRDVGLVAMAIEQVGGASRCLDDTVSYVKERKQFGRAVGSFQTIKHRLANLLVRVESGRSIAYAALWAVSTDDPSAHRLALTAKAHCSDMYEAVAAESIQMHGGNGISWEYDAHLHFKRAHSSAQLFGSRRQIHRELALNYGYLATG